jgi:hypothetical protein
VSIRDWIFAVSFVVLVTSWAGSIWLEWERLKVEEAQRRALFDRVYRVNERAASRPQRERGRR